MNDPDTLVVTARTFLDAAMPMFKERCDGSADQALAFPGRSRWVRDESVGGLMGRFRTVPWGFSRSQQCALRVLNELSEEEFGSLGELERALSDDGVVGPRVAAGSVVSAGAGGGVWQARSLILVLVERLAELSETFELPDSERGTLVESWVGGLRREFDEITVVTALREFECSVTPLELEPGCDLVVLADEEIEVALTFGGGIAGLSLDERSVAQTFAIRTGFRSSLHVDEIPPKEMSGDVARGQDAERLAGRVVLALRLFKAGLVSASGVFRYSCSPSGMRPSRGSIGPGFVWHAAQPYVLAEDEIDPFREFWAAFRKSDDDALIRSVVRRFGYAASRNLADDKIVDLMIAAESLFLSGVGDEKQRGELGYRLSMRAAALLGSDIDERLRIRRFMSRAYGIRSTIVHGGTPKPKDVRNLEPLRVSCRLFGLSLGLLA